MILGIVLGFAALAVLSSVFGGGETDTSDPIAEDEGVAQSGGDQVFGGSGNDTITLGEGLYDLILGSWIEGAGPATVTDYSKAEDSLIHVYDSANSAPEMTLDTSTDAFGDPLDTLLYANGDLVAVIEGLGGVFTLGDVVLTPVSAPTSATA